MLHFSPDVSCSSLHTASFVKYRLGHRPKKLCFWFVFSSLFVGYDCFNSVCRGGLFLACGDYGERFDESFPACAFLFESENQLCIMVMIMMMMII